MNKAEKTLTFVLILVLSSTAFFFGSIISYPKIDYHVKYLEVWIDDATNDYAANQTIVIYQKSWWHIDITKITFEIMRSKNATELLQWSIERTDMLRIKKGTYFLTGTVYIHSSRHFVLIFEQHSLIVSTATPIISITATNQTEGKAKI